MKLWNAIKKYGIDTIFIIIIFYYLANCIKYTIENANFFYIIYIIPLLILYYIFFKIPDKFLEEKEKWIKIIIIFGSLFIYGTWNAFMRTLPISDYEILVYGAQEMAKGKIATLTFDPTNYFYYFNFQIGFISYLAIIIKLFGTRLVFLKATEILIMSMSNLLVYIIISKVSSKKTALLSAIVYASLLFNIVGSSIINNQHISMLFTLLVIYFYEKKEKKIFSILCGFFLGLSYIFRPSSVIFLIAFFCMLILNIIRNNFKIKKEGIIQLGMIIITFFAFTRLYDFTMHALKVVPNSAININAKYYKFVTGLQYKGITGSDTTDAYHTQIYYDIEYYNFDYDKYNKATKEYILNRYKNHTKEVLSYFFKEKMPYFTGYPDNQIDFSITEYINPTLLKMIRDCGYLQYIGMLLLSFFHTILLWKNKKMDEDHRTLYKIVFIGFFLSHFPIEVQTRYRYDQYLLLCLISIPMMEYLFQKIKFKKWKKER